jgi:hypothetical protein
MYNLERAFIRIYLYQIKLPCKIELTLYALDEHFRIGLDTRAKILTI